MPKILLLLSALLITPLSARTVTVAGSDLVPKEFIEALETFAKSRNDLLVTNMRGSLLAFREFNRGEADLIIVAIPRGSEEEYLFPVVPFGFQVGTIAVNKKNPIDEITSTQLGGVFGSPGRNTVTLWSELGLSGEWNRRIIKAGYADPPLNPVIDMFSAYFLENEPVREGIQSFDTDVGMESFISSNDDAIGILGDLPLDPQVKTLRISSEDDNVSFGPTVENVNFGDYPFTLPYIACVPVSQHRALAPYLEFILSDEIAAILEQEGFFPVLRSRRIQLTSALPSE